MQLNLNAGVPLDILHQVLTVSPEHPAVMLSLSQVQCQRLLKARGGTDLSDSVLEQLSKAVMMNPTNLGAWHVSEYRIILMLLGCLLLSSIAVVGQ